MLDLEEQEKIDILKAWWKQYASWVLPTGSSRKSWCLV